MQQLAVQRTPIAGVDTLHAANQWIKARPLPAGQRPGR
jgi:hypothetical protein